VKNVVQMRTHSGYTLSQKKAAFLGSLTTLDNAVMPENAALFYV
jgi:hypothetical protein